MRARLEGGKACENQFVTPVSELISVRHTDLYIGGSWRAASDQQRIDVNDPATGEVIATVASASVQDALAAVEAASEAFRPWATKPPRERAEILRRGFELMMRDQEKLAELMVRENGKPLNEARGEVAYAAEFFRWFSEEAVRNIGSLSIAPSGANRILVEHQPIGVSVLVTPWNFPAAMATRKIGPALAAGCTVILKPASETPLTALAVADLLEQAGVPRGVVNVIPSKRSSEVVKAMLKDPRVRKLSFTGSTEVGRILLAQAAENVISCSMELGGNAPFIVLDDANLDAALEGALVAKMRNTGQSCIAANRFYVDARVAGKFAQMLADAMAALPMGSGMDASVRVGPVINEPARRTMLGLVEEAAGHGARVLTGGKAPQRPGYFMPPTVLSQVQPDENILTQEIFGPIAPIVSFDTIDRAIEYANRTDRGLASYVYSADLAKGLRVAEAIESGMVGLNRGFISDPAAPFGGVKQSGVGREGSHEGLQEFLETKYIATSW
jgi:succinate-semialdehyde dehydrogenase/glutarate-semialdehyde dehydrogenase